ncbi:MAG: hypothetical protein WKG07_24595 [Hymenobacter sp.]
MDFSERRGFYLSPTVNHQARLPLNDANTEYAAGYWTMGPEPAGGTGLTQSGLDADVFAGVDNAANRRYSLGNDLNAFGGRYFQPAPGPQLPTWAHWRGGGGRGGAGARRQAA